MEELILSEVLKTTLTGLFFGTFGTTLGGIIGAVFKIRTNRILSFLLEFAARLNASYNLF